ncbi:MAG: CaiB/BaiF CoA transferase family protein [Candidatus Hodarchaeota archaeon]
MLQKKCLEDVKILDTSQFLSGPYASSLLADLGAEVWKVEPPIGETLRLYTLFKPSIAPMMSLLHRNKKAITLNLRTAEGKEIFKGLIRKVDVLLENNVPGYMDKLGLGYQVLKEINPGLVYCAISGFGQTGPLRDRTAFDMIAQATGGIMSVLEREDQAPSVFIADLGAGVHAAYGILAALHYRDKTGIGQFVDISMQDIMYAFNFRAVIRGALPEDSLQREDQERITVPIYHSFKCKNGYAAIVAITDRQWKRVVLAMDRKDLLRVRKFRNVIKRIECVDEIYEIVESWTKNKTVAEVVEIMENAKIPCGPIVPYKEVSNHPQILAREMVREFIVDDPEKKGEKRKIKIPGILIKLSETPGNIWTLAPGLGEHNEEIYKGILGYNKEKLIEFKKKGII